MSQSGNFFSINDTDTGVPRDLADGLTAQVYAGAEAMVSIVRIAPGKSGEVHSHPQEQWGFCIEGSGERMQGGEVFSVKVGDFWRTPGGVEHGFRAGPEGAVVYDVFAPVRQEYLKPGSGFGTGGETDA